MKRRQFLHASAGLLTTTSLSGCLPAGTGQSPDTSTGNAEALPVTVPELTPYEARPDRIIAFNVCTRPFRAQGPRIESEQIGRNTVVHNYGHGGSGWSLSWGSATLATELALATGQDAIAVVGCGAIGLTTAITAQRAGLKVNIYAKERPPYVRSSYATGVWSPESRICTLPYAEAFAEKWERMVRISHRRFQTLLGQPGHPVEWTSIYHLSDNPFNAEADEHGESNEPEYPAFTRKLIPDLTPASLELTDKPHPFHVNYVRRSPLMLFNISTYSHLLMEEFHAGGGEIHTFELKDTDDFMSFDERTVINCTGYGARDLLGDESITPVRGQTCKMIPQPELNYGIRYDDKHVYAYPRRDGVLVQAGSPTDFGNPEASVDPMESISAVERLADVMLPLVKN